MQQAGLKRHHIFPLKSNQKILAIPEFPEGDLREVEEEASNINCAKLMIEVQCKQYKDFDWLNIVFNTCEVFIIASINE